MKPGTKTFNAIVAAALLSSGSAVASTVDVQSTFIPFEKLAPSERAVLEERIKALIEYVKIDWKTVEIGVNEKGELVLRGRDPNAPTAANPSCWAID